MSEEEVTEPKKQSNFGLATLDTPVPEGQNDDPRFIASPVYFEKYKHHMPASFSIRDMAPACRKWHEDETIPEASRRGLISEKRLVMDNEARMGRDGKPYRFHNRKRWQWHIFDIPPSEHPGWNAYVARIIKNIRSHGRHIAEDFEKLAPIFLERFDEARIKVDHTQFKIGELAGILKTNKLVIKSWTEVGVKGYGKLPHIKASEGIRPLQVDGAYISLKKAGRVDFYYATKDIRRFFKGELADVKGKRFKTLDDATEQTNIDEIASESGYFVYDLAKAYPLTYDGFITWAKKNIVFYDRSARRIMPFNPSPKQIEFYKEVFQLKPDGTLQHHFDFTCRPRGDYKTFDVSIIVLFRFLNLPYERIYLVTNSVQQTTHLVYREVHEQIKKSPTLSAMLNTPALDIQRDGIYLRAGKGLENVFSSIEIISSEGGARSNATCIAWSECWKHKGKEEDASEVMDSIRGVESAMFLAESTVAPKGHWFHRHFEVAQEGGQDAEGLYFQYYDGTHRQNPKVTDAFLNLKKKTMPLQWKQFFLNRWEDAATGLFSEARIIEMHYLGIHKGTYRNEEMLHALDNIVDLNIKIKKFEGGIDLTNLKRERDNLIRLLNPVSQIYTMPAEPETLLKLSDTFNCDFIIGIGLDRAKHLQDRADRTVQATVARAIFSEEQARLWGTDRIFFLLNLKIFTELMGIDSLIQSIEQDINTYGGGFGYVDLEDYNVIDLYKSLEEMYGKESINIAPNSLKHQTLIFTEMHLAAEGGYLKFPYVDIWTDEDDKLHETIVPLGKQDIIVTEMSVFENAGPTSGMGRASAGWFGSPYKKISGRTPIGKPKDDCVFAFAHAMNAAIRGDIPAVVRNAAFASAAINKDVLGDYR